MSASPSGKTGKSDTTAALAFLLIVAVLAYVAVGPIFSDPEAMPPRLGPSHSFLTER